jgi:hypothetical protein
MSAADSERTSESREAHELALTVSTAQKPRAFHWWSQREVETTWAPPPSLGGRLVPRCGRLAGAAPQDGSIGGCTNCLRSKVAAGWAPR